MKRRFFTLYSITLTVMLSIGCEKNLSDEFFDCVGDMDLDNFYFLGTNNGPIEFYNLSDNYIYLDSYGLAGANASITFKDDETFSLSIELVCDSSVNVSGCDSVSFISHLKEIEIEGIYSFTQNPIG